LYNVKNKVKYLGDKKNIRYRSSWERGLCKWCDKNDKVIGWCIEPFPINYFDKGNNKHRKYWPDFYIEMINGGKYLIEVKPDHETRRPKKQRKSNKTKRFLLAEQTYVTNTSKWEAAKEYCSRKNWEFKIFTENTLMAMGIKIINLKKSKRKKYRRI